MNNDSGRDGSTDASGGVVSGCEVDQDMVKVVVLKALLDPAVIRQMVPTVSGVSGPTSTSMLTSAMSECEYSGKQRLHEWSTAFIFFFLVSCLA